jgi:hypothetical protein
VVAGYTTVFAIDAVLFIVAAVLAARIGMTASAPAAAAREGAHRDTAGAGNGFKAGIDGGLAPGLNVR